MKPGFTLCGFITLMICCFVVTVIVVIIVMIMPFAVVLVNSRKYRLILGIIMVSIGPGWPSRYSDSLRVGRSVDQIPVVARFSAPVQTGSGAYPACYTMGTGSFSWW